MRPIRPIELVALDRGAAFAQMGANAYFRALRICQQDLREIVGTRTRIAGEDPWKPT